MNKCELILAMIAGMFQAVFKGVRYRIYKNKVLCSYSTEYELTVFIPKRGTYRPFVDSIAHLVSEHLSIFDRWLPDSFGITQWELTDGAEDDDISSNNEDYLLYRIKIVK